MESTVFLAHDGIWKIKYKKIAGSYQFYVGKSFNMGAFVTINKE